MRTSTSGSESHSSHDGTVYIGRISNGILTELMNFPESSYRTDRTVAEVTALREKVRQAKAALSKAQSELSPFGEY